MGYEEKPKDVLPAHRSQQSKLLQDVFHKDLGYKMVIYGTSKDVIYPGSELASPYSQEILTIASSYKAHLEENDLWIEFSTLKEGYFNTDFFTNSENGYENLYTFLDHASRMALSLVPSHPKFSIQD